MHKPINTLLLSALSLASLLGCRDERRRPEDIWSPNSGVAADVAVAPMELHYVEFQLETLIAVTRENIESTGSDGKALLSDRITVPDEAQARAIAGLLVQKSKNPTRFDELKVRLRVESPAFDGPLFVDNKGTADYKGQVYRLEPAAFEKLAATLKPLFPKA